VGGGWGGVGFREREKEGRSVDDELGARVARGIERKDVGYSGTKKRRRKDCLEGEERRAFAFLMAVDHRQEVRLVAPFFPGSWTPVEEDKEHLGEGGTG